MVPRPESYSDGISDDGGDDDHVPWEAEAAQTCFPSKRTTGTPWSRVRKDSWGTITLKWARPSTVNTAFWQNTEICLHDTQPLSPSGSRTAFPTGIWSPGSHPWLDQGPCLSMNLCSELCLCSQSLYFSPTKENEVRKAGKSQHVDSSESGLLKCLQSHGHCERNRKWSFPYTWKVVNAKQLLETLLKSPVNWGFSLFLLKNYHLGMDIKKKIEEL